MRQLRGPDARFLYADSGHANANVTLVHIYDPSTAPGGRVRFKQILAHIEARLHRSPVFRRRLLRVPLELDYPYWIEDERFDLEYHVRHIALPAPGDWRQFCIQASRIHARPLDLSRPLWEIHVIEGLHGLLGLPEGSFALLTKVHHAAIDLEDGSELTMLLHDTVADPPAPAPPEPWFPESPPGTLSLLARSVVRNALSPIRLARPLATLATRLAPAAASLVSEVMMRPDAIPVTRFNAIVSPHRVFETRRFPLADFRRIRDLVEGATVNDAVLAVCAGGLRRYLARSGELPDASLVAIAPTSLRGADDEDGARTELALLRAELGTQLEDPIERLAFLRRQAAESEAYGRAVPASELTDVQRHTPALTLAFAAKLLGGATAGAGRRAPLAHCTIVNVPGPSVPLYLGGARMTYFSAIMPIADGMGLVFAVTSYDGMLIVSPTACREQVPDPGVLAQCVRDSFQEYLALADARTAPTKRSRRATAAPAPAAATAPAARRVRSAPRTASASGTASPAGPAGRTAATRPPAARAARRRSTSPAR
ncbi:MAG: wax ester/triacylglycerol synthase family O-acyltransferase [Burkholderiales bacterium]